MPQLVPCNAPLLGWLIAQLPCEQFIQVFEPADNENNKFNDKITHTI